MVEFIKNKVNSLIVFRYENTARTNDILSATMAFMTDYWGRGELSWAELAVRARYNVQLLK